MQLRGSFGGKQGQDQRGKCIPGRFIAPPKPQERVPIWTVRSLKLALFMFHLAFTIMKNLYLVSVPSEKKVQGPFICIEGFRSPISRERRTPLRKEQLIRTPRSNEPEHKADKGQCSLVVNWSNRFSCPLTGNLSDYEGRKTLEESSYQNIQRELGSG